MLIVNYSTKLMAAIIFVYCVSINQNQLFSAIVDCWNRLTCTVSKSTIKLGFNQHKVESSPEVLLYDDCFVGGEVVFSPLWWKYDRFGIRHLWHVVKCC